MLLVELEKAYNILSVICTCKYIDPQTKTQTLTMNTIISDTTAETNMTSSSDGMITFPKRRNVNHNRYLLSSCHEDRIIATLE